MSTMQQIERARKIEAYNGVIEFIQENIDKDGEFYIGKLTPLFDKSEKKTKEKLTDLMEGRWFWRDEKGLIHNPKTKDEIERHLVENVLNLFIVYGDLLQGEIDG